MRDIQQVHLNDEVTLEQIISTCGWYGTVTNHQNGMRWYRCREYGFGQLLGFENVNTPEEYYDTLIGEPVTIIEPLNDLRNQLLIFIVAQQNTME